MNLQLRAYQERTGLSAQSGMPELLGCTVAAYDSYIRRTNPKEPLFSKGMDYARRMLVSASFLTGASVSEMWDADLLRPMRTALRRYVIENPPGPNNHAKRICELIRWTHQYNDTMFDAIILSAVCRRPKSTIQAILAGENLSLAHPTPDYLAEFWQLRPLWVLGEDGPAFVEDLSHRQSVVYILDEDGITNATVINNRGLLKDLQAAAE